MSEMLDSGVQSESSWTNCLSDANLPQNNEQRNSEEKKGEAEAIPLPGEDEDFVHEGIEPEPKPDGDLHHSFFKSQESNKARKKNVSDQLLFHFSEPLNVQMERLAKLKVEDPETCLRIHKRGQLIVQLAKKGDLSTLEKILEQSPKNELPYWFIIQAFKEATSAFMANVVVFMLDNGLDLKAAPLQETLLNLISTAQERDFRLPAMIDLLIGRGLDVNHQRKGDFLTALHIACQKGLYSVVRQLIFLGADVNAVAKDDVMPLQCAEKYYEQVTSSVEDYSPRQQDCAAKIREILLRRNARLNWRTDPPMSEEEKKIVRFMEEQEASGAFSGGC